MKAMCQEPLRRYPDAGEMAEDLQRFMEGRPIEAPPATRWRRILDWTRQKPKDRPDV